MDQVALYESQEPDDDITTTAAQDALDDDIEPTQKQSSDDETCEPTQKLASDDETVKAPVPCSQPATQRFPYHAENGATPRRPAVCAWTSTGAPRHQFRYGC